MSDKKPKAIPIEDLVSEDRAHELATSPDMQPYLRLIKAGMQDRDTAPHMEEIAALPLEKRYVWRVGSALKWAFVDLETVSVDVDRETLSEVDLKKLVELLRLRPIQFCIFLKALLGEEAMERLMKDGIEGAKRRVRSRAAQTTVPISVSSTASSCRQHVLDVGTQLLRKHLQKSNGDRQRGK